MLDRSAKHVPKDAPPADERVLARKAEIARALAAIVPDGMIDDPDALRAYGSDGLCQTKFTRC